MALLLCIIAPRAAQAAKVYVYAAASLGPALQELVASQPSITLVLGASSDLARQVAAGAPADVFVSADLVQMQRAQTSASLSPSVKLLTNRLVVIVGDTLAPAWTSIEQLRSFSKVALADPAMVPAGVYAKQWLALLSVWDAVQPHVVPLTNVRAALMAVATQTLPVGIVYRTDVETRTDVRVVFEQEPQAAQAIYYAAVRKDPSPQAQTAWRLLHSKEASRIFSKHGFGLGGAFNSRGSP